jgi:phospholipid-binding lipoprotein MlaA
VPTNLCSAFRPLLPALCGLALLSGCAATVEKRDPLEPFNRMMWSINKAADVTILKPVSTIYNQVFPQFLRTGFYNMYHNLRDFITFPNQFLQGKVGDGWDTVGRIAINSTLGVVGFFDVASWGNIPRSREDFGQTLAVWGVGSGPYLFIPLFGPSNFRDGAALIPDLYLYPLTWIDNVALQNSLYAANVVIVRADATEAMRFVNEAAVDEYAFLRDAFFQRRLYDIYDGNPPKVNLEDEDDDDKNEPVKDKKGDAASPGTPSLATAPIEAAGQFVTTESGAPIGTAHGVFPESGPLSQPR